LSLTLLEFMKELSLLCRFHYLLMVGLLLLVACADTNPAVEQRAASSSVSAANTTATAETVAPADTPTLAPVSEPTATATAVPPTPSPTVAPATLIPTLNLAETGCGVHLPLVAPPDEPTTTAVNPTWPDNFSIPDEARPALVHLLAHPGDVGLVAFRVGQEEQGLYLNADMPMPLASVVKLIHLVAYVEAVSDGRLDPSSWVPVADLEQYFLPGSDLRAHPRALEELTERRLVGRNPPAVPLEELPWMMMRYSSNSATDYLHLRLGQEVIEETAVRLNLTSQTAPCPFLGQFLLISNHTRTVDNSSAIQALIDDPALYGQAVMDLTAAYSSSEQFRLDEGRWYQRSRRPTWQDQSLFSENLNAQGSARDYAHLMALIAQEQIGDPYANFLARRYLEWPLDVYPINQELFHMVGYKNGSLPGILTTVYYASPRDQGGLVVVALFFRNLPEATYREWRRSLTHDDLARWLLTDPRAIGGLRSLLTE
jgi:D-alanyl-D-alanine carboxypeptidase